ncbi:hypothetical protein ACS3UN_10055 [Oscillospiraceae bacterium LTW-04]|nr:hypothetical protein RBH76_11805 [Oscillospiraceae bacterium MB24-C1]
MRKLTTQDVFVALRIVSDLQLKDEVQTLAKLANDKELSRDEIGAQAFMKVLDLFVSKKAEGRVYEFLAGPFEMTPEQVRDLELMVLANNLQLMAEENNIAGFFTLLGGLTTPKPSTSSFAAIAK